MTQKKKNRRKMLELGFIAIDTGGGCTAYSADIGNEKYILVTDDAEMPKKRSDTIVIGFYAEDGTQTGFITCKFSTLLDGDIILGDIKP